MTKEQKHIFDRLWEITISVSTVREIIKHEDIDASAWRRAMDIMTDIERQARGNYTLMLREINDINSKDHSW